MPKARVTHYRPTIDWKEPACSAKISIRDVEWSFDPNDTTCNNCAKTDVHIAGLEKKNKVKA